MRALASSQSCPVPHPWPCPDWPCPLPHSSNAPATLVLFLALPTTPVHAMPHGQLGHAHFLTPSTMSIPLYILVLPWLRPHKPSPTLSCPCPGSTIPGFTHTCLPYTPHQDPAQPPPCQPDISKQGRRRGELCLDLGHGYSHVRGQVHG